MTTDLLLVVLVVALAELGDKTQLVAFTGATRHGPLRALAALTATIVVLQTISVSAGAAVDRLLPDVAVTVTAGLLFIAFGATSWLRAANTADEPPQAADHPERSPTIPSTDLARLAGLFFVAELGDKTMFTTAGLATARSITAVWLGSVAAMTATTAVTVAAGAALAKRLQPAVISRAGGVLFLIIGALTLGTAVS
ncbi:MAG: TMEM165/GDT1 family protein [Actinomycetota bacterium]